MALAAGLMAMSCASSTSGPPPATGPTVHAESTVDAGSAATRPVREATLVTYTNGARIALERFRDDGERLISQIVVVNTPVQVNLARAPRHVAVRQGARGEQRTEQDVPADTVVMQNGSWQQFAIMAEWFPGATTPTPVHVLIPSQPVTVDGTLTVRPGIDGARTVELVVAGQTMTAEVSADGLVTRARVPAQGVEMRPESEPPPPVTYAPPPAGITEEAIEVDRAGVAIRGVIWRPASATGPVPVMVIVVGSGPTDREGNSILNLHTDCYRLLAESLAARGIATVRFDKRGVGASGTNFRPQDISFDDVVGDAQAIVERVRADARFSHVTLAGHSEGGLIALRVAEHVPVNALVLIASVGRPFGVIIREQFARQMSAADMAEFDRVVGEIRAGRQTTSSVPAIQSTLNPALNLNYIRQEIDLDPAALLHAQHIPTVVIQGDTDIQVMVADARALAAARPDVRLVLLPHVNHVLREEATATPDQASYHNAALPLGPGVLDAVYSGIAGTAPPAASHAPAGRGRRRGHP